VGTFGRGSPQSRSWSSVWSLWYAATVFLLPKLRSDENLYVENHIPTYLYCAEILSESLDISPLFLETYTSRVRARLENDEELAGQIPELIKQGDPRVLVLARLQERRVEQWLPDFEV
jgi:hypothetical protein